MNSCSVGKLWSLTRAAFTFAYLVGCLWRTLDCVVPGKAVTRYVRRRLCCTAEWPPQGRTRRPISLSDLISHPQKRNDPISTRYWNNDSHTKSKKASKGSLEKSNLGSYFEMSCGRSVNDVDIYRRTSICRGRIGVAERTRAGRRRCPKSGRRRR